MASIRNNKNIQSAVASAVFVGLRAEHSHISKLHATNFYTDEDEDIFETIRTLKESVQHLTQQNSELIEKMDKLSLVDLKDVNILNAANGDALVFQNGSWQPAELFKEDS